MGNARTAAARAGLIAALMLAPFGVASADGVVASGTLAGRSGHTASGAVSLVKVGSRHEIRLGADFSLDRAPGPWIAFGNNGRYDRATLFSRLKTLKGAQTYKVPGRIDVSKYSEFYLWCRPFNVPLGVAKLSR